MRRVSVVGNSGSGKSTLAAALAGRLGVPWLELDSVFHMAGWTPRPTEEFRAEVDAFTAGDGWVVDGNYSAVRDLVWSRADTVVWIDLPRPAVMRQLLARTLRRMATGAELWNGNRESFRFLLDKDESIIRFAWQQHAVYRERYRRAAADPANAHLDFVRVASRADAERLARADKN
jgi:adenylate kinase family enzyme